MKSKRATLAAAGVLVVVALAVAILRPDPATRAGEAKDRKADEKAIREIAQSFARAFEKGDARAVGAFFTNEGEYIDDDGESLRGRPQLEKAYAKFFADRPELKANAKTADVRFLGKDTAVEEGTFSIHAKGRPAQASRYSTLFVRQDGRWLMALVKEWGDETTDRPNLHDLAWLIGSWQSDSPELHVRTTYEWSEKKKFIRCHFVITQKKDKTTVSSGTQVIGVDPAFDRIRAWVFDSDGGIGESTWAWDRDHWVIDSHATLADGQETSAVNFLARAGDDAFTWRSVHRTLDGERQPDLGPIKVQRVKSGK
jgi:uncharacterized protein (TIGR02246 family)